MTTLLDRLGTALADRYALEREIGEGGMATVFLATDVRHERRVAIKVLHPELSAMLGPDRFLSEIKLTASLQHPHILPLFDSGAADGLLYYVMPFVEGETLRGRLQRERQLPVPDAVRLATEIADALAYAHARGIVHRDVKPENVLLQAGRAMVADFGIALAVQHAGGSRMTQTGMSLGTPQYMAPEQAMGERNIDARADIYALGAMTYEMLAGEPPFTGPTAQAIVARVMTERARPLREVRDTVPEAVEAAVWSALEKLPADRFASATLFSEALGTPVATPPRARTGATTPQSRVAGRRVVTLTALAALAGAVGGGAAIWAWRAPANEAQPLALHIEVAPPDSVSLRLICCGGMFAISPDGRYLLFQGSPRSDSVTEGPSRGVALYLRDLTELGARRLPGTESATSMFFSPRGDEIGFVSDRRLWRLPLTASEPQLVATVPDGFVGGGSWSEDGNITLAVSGQMLHVPATGGSLVPLFAPDSTGLQFGGPQRWSREQVLLYSRSAIGQLQEVHWRSLETGESRVIANGATPTYVPSRRALLLVRGDGALLQYPFNLATGDTTGPGIVLANKVERRSPLLIHAEYAVSATGTLVMVKRPAASPTSGLSFVNLDPQAPPPSSELPAFALLYFLDFAPADTRLLVTGVRGVGQPEPFVLDVRRGALTRLPVTGIVRAVGWSHRGDSVLYSENGDQVIIRASDGSGTPMRTLQLRDWKISGRMSAWGPWVAFYRSTGTDSRQIGVAHRDSMGVVRAIGGNGGWEHDPAISPDGQWLAFTSRENGREEVFVTAFPVPSGRFPVSLRGGTYARWGRDGRTLYFQQQNQIMATTFAGGPTPMIGSPRMVYRRDPWGLAAVSSDGKLLVFADAAREGTPAALTVQVEGVRRTP